MIRHKLTLLILTLFSFGSARVPIGVYIDDNLRDEFYSFLKERLHIVAAMNHTTPLRFLQASITLVDCDEWDIRKVNIARAQTILTEETCGTRNMQDFCHEYNGRTVTMMMKNDGISTIGQFECALKNVPMAISLLETIMTRMVIPLSVLCFVTYVIYTFRKMCKEKSEQSKLAPAIKTIIDNSMETVTLDSTLDKKSRKLETVRFDEISDPSIGTIFTLNSPRQEKFQRELARFDEDSDASIGTVFTI